eukprot:34298_1
MLLCKRDKKKQVIWKGFIVPPTHGTVGVNKLDDEKEFKEEEKQYAPLAITKQLQQTIAVDKTQTDHCAGRVQYGQMIDFSVGASRPDIARSGVNIAFTGSVHI